jgi:light-regulated signal transduction histidine kinase (bacteriophytochrome)
MTDGANQPAREAQQRQQLELERLGHDVKLQARVAAQDLQRPIERILECCRRLEEQSGGMDSDSHALLAEARKAAAEARRLVLQLQAVVAARTG